MRVGTVEFIAFNAFQAVFPTKLEAPQFRFIFTQDFLNV